MWAKRAGDRSWPTCDFPALQARTADWGEADARPGLAGVAGGGTGGGLADRFSDDGGARTRIAAHPNTAISFARRRYVPARRSRCDTSRMPGLAGKKNRRRFTCVAVAMGRGRPFDLPIDRRPLRVPPCKFHHCRDA
jgi:hypothetical protein